MHKLGMAFVLAAALVLPVTASAEKPIKSPSPFPTFSVPAGVVCPFEMLWESPVNKNFQNVHLDANGNVRWIWGGGNNVARITNVANGKVYEVNTTGPGKNTFGADGSLTIDGTGHWLVGYGPADSPSSSMIFYSGHIVLHVTAEGVLSLVSYNGAAPVDVCAALT
jgi:hypothetical protein